MEGIKEPIYKISHVVDNDIKIIFVFLGKVYVNDKKQDDNDYDDIDLLFKNEPENIIFDGVFEEEELEDITEENTIVRFIPERLHLDDTIEIVKKKIMLHLIDDLNASFDELYFFIKQTETFQILSLYQNLTQNDKLPLTRDKMIQYFYNVDEIDIETIPDKEYFKIDDLFKMNLENSLFTLSKPLGHNFISLSHDYPYTVNPFDVITYDTFLEKYAEELTTTTNKNLLMHCGNILNNTIYLSLAEDVLNYARENDLSENTTLKIYFPFLYKKNIISIDNLNDEKQTLNSETMAMINDKFIKNINNVSLFYDIYNNRKESLNFTDVGIKSINMTIRQSSEFNLPLDIVFKLIHATQDIPLIKMNLSKKRENIYRLYTDKITTNGKKIPYLDKNNIFRWDKVMGKHKSVSLYIEYFDKEQNSTTPIICEFNSNGDINIKSNFNKNVSISDVNELLKSQVNPVINVVKEYLAEGGYSMNNFTDLHDKTIEIINIDFSMYIPIEKQLKIKQFAGCITSMFNIVNSNFNEGIILRFKRVENYNEIESQEALIMDMLQPHFNYSDADIIKIIQTNYNISETDAREKYIEVKRSQELMQTGNKRLKLGNNNPGFFISIKQKLHGNIVIINVSGINDIKYLDVLTILLDSLIRITQYPKTTLVSSSDISTLCKGKTTQDEQKVDEIKAYIQQSDKENMQMNIVNNELVFNNKEDNNASLEAETKYNDDIDDDDEIAEEDIDDLLAEYGMDDDMEENGEDEDEDEDEAEDEDEDEAQETGGAGKKSIIADDADAADAADDDIKRDITGLSLSNPSPFESKMIDYDKKLFVSDTGKKNMKSYATTCAWNRLRHPVILTDKEKEKIDRDHPGSYDKTFKYGTSTDEDKKFWYICPRYWSLRDNTSLNPDEVNPDEVIPSKNENVKSKHVVPPGKHIFEFNDKGIEHLDKNKEYKTHNPGFLKPNENGVCLPCCFSSWDKDEQIRRRATCLKKPETNVPIARKKKKNDENIDEYILSHDKFPITQENRFGFLPLAVQKFLHTDNKKCQISDLDTNIKPNYPCLLRHSVEINNNQSFVACIADIWHRMLNKKLPTIKEMKEIIIEGLDIDRFVALHNGNLVKIFYKNDLDNENDDEEESNDEEDESNDEEDESNDEEESNDDEEEESNDEEEEESNDDEDDTEELTGGADSDDETINENYADVFSENKSKLYEKADKTNPIHTNALNKIATAYTNFKDYLRDEKSEIDSQYLWDLICIPNPKIFPAGLNMVIIELSRKDITDNVEILCPSNHYSDTFFDAKKRTVLILKIDNFYEPIYSYKNDKQITIIPNFTEMAEKELPNIKQLLSLMKIVLSSKCKPQSSMPTIYHFKKNMSLTQLLKCFAYKSRMKDYTIDHYVKNYDNKIIGINVMNNKTNQKGFIPCYPSPLPYPVVDNIVWSDDIYTNTYENTKTFLTDIYNVTHNVNKILCKPYAKVFEDGLIVGILTITNQFILISEPIQDTFGDDLKIIDGSNYTDVDKTISTSNDVDSERVNFIKKIHLETMFYNAFRNTARYLLGQHENNDIRREIEEKTKSTNSYLKKMHSIETLLRDVMEKRITFHDYDDSEILKLNNVTSCYNNCKNKPFCKKIEEEASEEEASEAEEEASEAEEEASEAEEESDEYNQEGGDNDIKCALMIPETNLINKKINDTFYFGKLADEIIRYKRIKSFIFNPKTLMSFSNVNYNLRENEIILLQSLLNKEYFENNVIAKDSQYITKNTYDTSQPLKTQTYSNVENIEDIKVDKILQTTIRKEQSQVKKMEHKDDIDNCKTILKDKFPFSRKYFTKIFPIGSKENVYIPSDGCYYKPLLTIIKDYNDSYKNITQNDLEKALVDEYRKIYDKYSKNILNILKAQHKKILSDLVTNKKLDFFTMIISENYYLTLLDYWLLAKHYNLPLIFMSDTSLMENNKQIMVAHTDNKDAYYFLKTTSTFTFPNKSPTYTLIFDKNNNIKIPVNELRDDGIKEEIRNGFTDTNLIDFIEKFTLKYAHTRKRLPNKTQRVATEPAMPEPAMPEPAISRQKPVKKLSKKIKMKKIEN